MEVVIDTNALSAWLDGDPGIEQPLSSAARLLLSPIVLGEYRFGVQASYGKQFYEAKLQALERQFKVLVIDAQTAACYAEVRRKLKAKGTPIPWHDVWIAAQAKQHGVSILSNDSHFDVVDGLTRIGW